MASTRETIIDAALDLFARRGFEATRVREIEEAAGLSPGGGSFYRHFASKDVLLEALVAREGERVREELEWRRRTLQGSLGDLRAELVLVMRTILLELEHRQQLIALLAQLHGDRPALLEELRVQLVDDSHTLTAALLAERMDAGDLPRRDPSTTAAILSNALLGYHLTRSYFGASPGGVDDETFLATLADLVVGAPEQHPRSARTPARGTRRP